MRRFLIGGDDPHKLWVPVGVRGAELDAWPRCMRCSARRGHISTAIEAYWIEDVGDRRVEVVGRCRGTCENVEGLVREPKEKWHDAVKITWGAFSDGTTDEMMQRDLVRQIAAIHFFDEAYYFDDALKGAA